MFRALLIVAIGLSLTVSVFAQDDDLLPINFCTHGEWEQILQAFEFTVDNAISDMDDKELSIGDTVQLRTLAFIAYHAGSIGAQCASTAANSQSHNADEGDPLILGTGNYLIEVVADGPVTLIILNETEVGADCEEVRIETEPDDAGQSWHLYTQADNCGTRLFVETEAESWAARFRLLPPPGFSIEE